MSEEIKEKVLSLVGKDEKIWEHFYNFIMLQRKRKEKAISKFKEILLRAKERGHLPLNNDSNNKEKKDFIWIINKKMARKGTIKNRCAFYPELQEIATEAGYPDLFEIKKLTK